MSEIIIRLESKNDDAGKRLIAIVKVTVLLINASALAVMVVEAIDFVQALDNTYSCKNPDPTICNNYFYNYMGKLGIISGTYYGILSLALIGVYVMLNFSLKKRFNQ